jgi:hypothetical protein
MATNNSANKCVAFQVGQVNVTVCDSEDAASNYQVNDGNNYAAPGYGVPEQTLDELYEQQVRDKQFEQRITPGWYGVWKTNHGFLVLKPGADATQVRGFLGDSGVGVALAKTENGGDRLRGDYRDVDDSGSFVLELRSPTAFAGEVWSSRRNGSRAKRMQWKGNKIRSLRPDELAPPVTPPW